MVFSEYTKQQILFYYEQDKAPPSISQHLLQEEGIVASRRGILKCLKCYEETGTIVQKRGTGCVGKVNGEKKQIEERMNTDDETTASQLVEMLASKGHRISRCAVERWRRALGWAFRGSSYCQLICDANKEKRQNRAQQYPGEAADGA